MIDAVDTSRPFTIEEFLAWAEWRSGRLHLAPPGPDAFVTAFWAP